MLEKRCLAAAAVAAEIKKGFGGFKIVLIFVFVFGDLLHGDRI